MKRLLMAAAAVLALTGLAGAGNLFDENGKHIGVSVDRGNVTEITYDDGTKASDAFYVLNGKHVSVFTYPDGTIEARWIGGPVADRAPVIFNTDGRVQEDGAMVGEARSNRPGCQEWFQAFIEKRKDDTLVLTPYRRHLAKCKMVFRPVTTYRTLGR
jgi:hypothetical protein